MSETPHIEDEQRHVSELLRSFDDVPAPDSLHARIDSMVASHPSPRAQWRPFTFASAGVAVAAVAAVVLVVALSGGGSGSGVSFNQAAAPTLRAATLPAPAQSQANHAELAVAVDDVAFPDWASQGWHSTGSRIDRVDGRSITTVFYANTSGQRIGYSILSGTPAPSASGGAIDWNGPVPYRVLTENGASTVTWLRDGHLCVISGHGVSSKTLLGLASGTLAA
jgi:hypothetical protein